MNDKTEGPKTPNVLHDTVIVPAGHEWSSGHKLERSIKLVVTYGVRWMPDAPAPLWHVKATQFFPNGDGIGYNADTLREEFRKLLPLEAACIAEGRDGTTVRAEDAGMIQMLGIAIPSEPETHADLNADRAYAKAHGIIHK